MENHGHFCNFVRFCYISCSRPKSIYSVQTIAGYAMPMGGGDFKSRDAKGAAFAYLIIRTDYARVAWTILYICV